MVPLPGGIPGGNRSRIGDIYLAVPPPSCMAPFRERVAESLPAGGPRGVFMFRSRASGEIMGAPWSNVINPELGGKRYSPQFYSSGH